MDLTPLYELRDRLRSGIIAGAALAAEDFKLARALEALAPLEKASPVFARLGQLTRAVLAPDCEDRAGALLDAVTLCDALLTTQASVAVPGELKPLPERKKGRAYTNAPYSVVAPLVEALTTSGSGHFSLVQDTLDTRSGLFRDYRVQQAMVQALGAGYGELADLVQRYMMNQDESVLPLLMEGFDPAGKKEMVRRVQIIESIAGERMNDWYLEQLERSKKQVRGALIYALRHDPRNLEMLLELAKKEKGDNKKLVLWALARMETPGTEAFWREQTAKNFQEAVGFFACSNTAAVTALTAELFQKELDGCSDDPSVPFPPEKEEHLRLLLFVLVGKTGEAICEVYRRAAAMGPILDQLRVSKDDKGRPVCEQMLFWCAGDRRSTRSFTRALVDSLLRSIQISADPMLCALAEELHRRHGGYWAAPLLTATLLTKGSREAAEVGKRVITARLIEKITGSGIKNEVLDMTFDRLCGRREQVPAYQPIYGDPAVGAGVFDDALHRYIPLPAHLDSWWFDLFMERHMEQRFRSLLNPADPEQCRKVSRYLYDRIRMGKVEMVVSTAVQVLKECGWTDWKGLVASYVRHCPKAVNYWNVISALRDTTLSDKEKGEELADIYARGRYSGWPQKAVEKQIQDWLQG